MNNIDQTALTEWRPRTFKLEGLSGVVHTQWLSQLIIECLEVKLRLKYMIERSSTLLREHEVLNVNCSC